MLCVEYGAGAVSKPVLIVRVITGAQEYFEWTQKEHTWTLCTEQPPQGEQPKQAAQAHTAAFLKLGGPKIRKLIPIFSII